jgi:hypothetical protein
MSRLADRPECTTTSSGYGGICRITSETPHVGLNQTQAEGIFCLSVFLSKNVHFRVYLDQTEYENLKKDIMVTDRIMKLKKE